MEQMTLFEQPPDAGERSSPVSAVAAGSAAEAEITAAMLRGDQCHECRRYYSPREQCAACDAADAYESRRR